MYGISFDDGQWKILLIDRYVMRELSHAFND